MRIQKAAYRENEENILVAQAKMKDIMNNFNIIVLSIVFI